MYFSSCGTIEHSNIVCFFFVFLLSSFIALDTNNLLDFFIVIVLWTAVWRYYVLSSQLRVGCRIFHTWGLTCIFLRECHTSPIVVASTFTELSAISANQVFHKVVRIKATCCTIARIHFSRAVIAVTVLQQSVDLSLIYCTLWLSRHMLISNLL